MSWEIRVLDLGSVELDQGRMLQNGVPGKLVPVRVNAFLLLGPQGPVVVDTGFRSPEILGRLRMRAFETPEQRLEAQLKVHGVAPGDVAAVVHTHLHIDHAGQTDIFPMTTPVVVNRRELEYSVCGLSGPSYPPEDIKHLIDRLHTRGALRLLDAELVREEEIFAGLRALPAGGHTEGSIVLHVDTADGLACLCGDVFYSLRAQLEARSYQTHDPMPSGNYVVSRREEKAAMKRVLQAARRIYPSHDAPAIVEGGRIVGTIG